MDIRFIPIASVRNAKPRTTPTYPSKGNIHMVKGFVDFEVNRQNAKDEVTGRKGGSSEDGLCRSGVVNSVGQVPVLIATPKSCRGRNLGIAYHCSPNY
jgi:hypothetical protein